MKALAGYMLLAMTQAIAQGEDVVILGRHRTSRHSAQSIVEKGKEGVGIQRLKKGEEAAKADPRAAESAKRGKIVL